MRRSIVAPQRRHGWPERRYTQCRAAARWVVRRLAPAGAAAVEVPASAHALVRVQDGPAAEADEQMLALRLHARHRAAYEPETARRRRDRGQRGREAGERAAREGGIERARG